MEVTLTNVSKYFGDVVAVDDISFEFEDGQLTTLLGPSGCGKTTTLRCISGFYRPDRGDIYLGQTLANRIPPNKRDTVTVFQTLGIFPHMTVEENIGYGLRVRKVPTSDIGRRVQEQLKLVGLEGYGNRYPGQLSGGQQQRVALARSMVIEPGVLLLDEPLSDLDAKLKVTMRKEIRKLQAKLGITMIYVTHDQEEAMAISDCVVIMNDGEIQQSGTPLDVYRHPNNRFVAEFVGTANFFEGVVQGLNGDEAHLDLSFGEFVGEAADSLREGRSIGVLIRPESLKKADAEDGANVVHGKVTTAMFLGSVVRYEVDIGADRPLIVDLSQTVIDRLYEPGDDIALTVNKGNIRYVPL